MASVGRVVPHISYMKKWDKKRGFLCPKKIYMKNGEQPQYCLFFLRLIDRLDNKADNDQDRYKDNECSDYVDDRMLLDEHRGEHDKKAENVAQKEEELSVLECEMKACGNCESIVNVKARQHVRGRVDSVKIGDTIHEYILAVRELCSEFQSIGICERDDDEQRHSCHEHIGCLA